MNFDLLVNEALALPPSEREQLVESLMKHLEISYSRLSDEEMAALAAEPSLGVTEEEWDEYQAWISRPAKP